MAIATSTSWGSQSSGYGSTSTRRLGWARWLAIWCARYSNSSVTTTTAGLCSASTVTESWTLHDVHDPQLPRPMTPTAISRAHSSMSARVCCAEGPTRSPVTSTRTCAPSRSNRSLQVATIVSYARQAGSRRKPMETPDTGRARSKVSEVLWSISGGAGTSTSMVRMEDSLVPVLVSLRSGLGDPVRADLERLGDGAAHDELLVFLREILDHLAVLQRVAHALGVREVGAEHQTVGRDPEVDQTLRVGLVEDVHV